MALDEALLLGRLRHASPPTLRFFAWAPPTISLGYGQRLDGGVDVQAAAAMGVGLVRRLTGGSAILHESAEWEVTYSVAGAAGDFPGADDLHGTYRWIGAALAAGLRELGAPVEMVPVVPSDPAAMPAFCFARTGSHEIEVDGRKLVGSAQRRQGAAFLQHGSVMLAADGDRLRRVFPGSTDPLGGMTTLEAVLGRRPSFDETVERLAEGFRRVHGLCLDPGGLTTDEVELMGSLAQEKYETPEWTRARRTRSIRSVGANLQSSIMSPLTLPSPPGGERVPGGGM